MNGWSEMARATATGVLLAVAAAGLLGCREACPNDSGPGVKKKKEDRPPTAAELDKATKAANELTKATKEMTAATKELSQDTERLWQMLRDMQTVAKDVHADAVEVEKMLIDVRAKEAGATDKLNRASEMAGTVMSAAEGIIRSMDIKVRKKGFP